MILSVDGWIDRQTDSKIRVKKIVLFNIEESVNRDRSCIGKMDHIETDHVYI